MFTYIFKILIITNLYKTTYFLIVRITLYIYTHLNYRNENKI